MKRVTYAIAAFNHARFVRESLESVWCDGYPLKEIVIVDDGSTDETADVVRSWCAEKDWVGITFHSGPNQGITATLNRLIAVSTGEYIRWVSSDDVLLTGGTEKMVRELEADPEAIAVFGDAILIDAGGAARHASTLAANGAKKSQLASRSGLVKEIVSNWSVSGPVLLIRRDFYSNHGLYDASLLVDDWDLYLRVAAVGGLRFVDEPVAKYRIHGSNTSRTSDTRKRIANLRSQCTVAEQNIALFSSKSIQDLLRSERYLLMAKMAYLSGRWTQCGAYLMTQWYFRLRSLFYSSSN